MKTIVLSIIITSLTFSFNLFAADSYSTDDEKQTSNILWLTGLPNYIRVNQLSLPGTHDTMTYTSKTPYVQTQALNLTSQLKSGIRVVDIRVQATNGKFAIHHDKIFLNKMFGDVLKDVTSFLEQHKGEFVLMRISKTSDSNGDHKTILENYISDYAKYFWKNSSRDTKNPEVGEIRGKIVLLRKDGWIPNVYGIEYPVYVQDNYNVTSLNTKYDQVIKAINQINGNPNAPVAINYLSGTGFPTLSPQTIAAYVNPKTRSYINNDNKNQIGMIMMDFPGGELINTIINYNIFYDMGYKHERFMADVNGDGKADFCREVGDGKKKYYTCNLSNGSGLTKYEFHIAQSGYPGSRQFVDIDGNGFDDFCREIGNRPNNSWLRCDLFGKEQETNDNIVIPKAQKIVNFNRKLESDGNWIRKFIDINNDGKVDLCRGITGGFKCYLYHETSVSNSRKGGAYFGLPHSKEMVFKLANAGDYGSSEFRELATLNKGKIPWFCRKLNNNTINCKQLKIDERGKGSFEKQHLELAYDAGYNDFKQIVDIDNNGEYEYCREVGNRRGNANKNRIECVRGRRIILSVQREYLGYSYFRQFADFNGDHKMEYIRAAGDEPATFLTISKYKKSGDKLVIPTGTNHYPGRE